MTAWVPLAGSEGYGGHGFNTEARRERRTHGEECTRELERDVRRASRSDAREPLSSPCVLRVSVSPCEIRVLRILRNSLTRISPAPPARGARLSSGGGASRPPGRVGARRAR